ncbi:heavy metal-binding domain-containing protein [uncultured Kordia sp.]|uniref:YbjQ family protein n=1 Tax=uncultured Kordia sp. TaxID=507699 RepID=UPI00260A907B|nr:heavy metal-binding domain-containing protein [uncultured Kordia sp.]
MIFTTTDTFQNREISEYLGLVSGMTYSVNYSYKGMSFKDMFNMKKYYSQIEIAIEEVKEKTFQKLSDNAVKLNADGVVGIDVDMEISAGGAVMVSITGTAVKLK